MQLPQTSGNGFRGLLVSVVLGLKTRALLLLGRCLAAELPSDPAWWWLLSGCPVPFICVYTSERHRRYRQQTHLILKKPPKFPFQTVLFLHSPGTQGSSFSISTPALSCYFHPLAAIVDGGVCSPKGPRNSPSFCVLLGHRLGFYC